MVFRLRRPSKRYIRDKKYASDGDSLHVFVRYCLGPGKYGGCTGITHMSMDVANGGKTDGANVQIYLGNGTGSQRWKLIKRPNGSYRIQALSDTSSTPFLLNIAAEPANHVNMQMWHEYSGVVRTEFDLEKVDDGITRVSSKTLEPVDKNAEPIRYSRLQVRDDLQPADSKPVIDTAYTNTRYQDLSASNINDKRNKYILNMESSSSKVTNTARRRERKTTRTRRMTAKARATRPTRREAWRRATRTIRQPKVPSHSPLANR